MLLCLGMSSILQVSLEPKSRLGERWMKVLFDTRRIQKLGRVALSEQLLRNAGLGEGDQVDIYFDAATKRIIIEPAQRDDASVLGKLASGRND